MQNYIIFSYVRQKNKKFFTFFDKSYKILIFNDLQIIGLRKKKEQACNPCPFTNNGRIPIRDTLQRYGFFRLRRIIVKKFSIRCKSSPACRSELPSDR